MNLKVWLAGLLLIFAVLISHQNCQKDSGRSKIDQSILQLSNTAPGIEVSGSALLIYQRLTGTKLPFDHAIIAEMNRLISQGSVDEAISMALNDDDFLNITIRDLASEMSNREETPVVPLNDFIASFIGLVRDGLNAQELLTGEFYYRAKSDTGVPSDLLDDIVSSNNHYQAIDDANLNVAEILERVDGQSVKSQDQVEGLADAAGVLTSRAFMKAHASDGTNRRLVQFAFREFLCMPISQWASTAYPDNRVGRDIGRSPISEYRNKCSGCHAPMDAMRPAFAYFDFINNSDSEGYISYKQRVEFDPREDDAAIIDVPVPADEQLVPSKFRRGSGVYPEGFKVKDDYWQNYTFANSAFGWRIRPSGNGIGQFAQMMAHSRAFSECMSKRVFKSICAREIEAEEDHLLSRLADRFETSQYNIKSLFADVIKRPECMGLDL